MNVSRFFILIGVYVGFTSLAFAIDTGDSSCLTLKEALQRVDSMNFQVLMANTRVEQSIARLSQAQSDLLPHVEGILGGSRQTVDLRTQGIQFPGLGTHLGPYNTFDARARVTIALFDPSAFERFRAAKKGVNLSHAQLEKTREDILGLVANLFVDAQRKAQSARLLKILLDRDQMAYALSEDGVTQGTGTLLNSNKLKSDLDQTKFLYNQAKLSAEEARLDLAAALQLPVNAPVIFLDDIAFLKTLENSTAVNFNRATSVDMVLAASQLEARRADQKAAHADFLPKVSGRSEYGRSGESPGRSSNTYFVGVQATVPIWEGGANQATLRQVKGEVKEAEENVLDTTQQTQINIVKARAAMIESGELRQSKAQARQTAQRALRIAFHAQEIGSGTVLELMQAKADLAMAEDEYNEAQATWVMSHINLLHAQGRLRELIKKGDK